MNNDGDQWQEYEKLDAWFDTVPFKEDVGGSTIYSEVRISQNKMILILVRGGHMLNVVDLPFFEDYEEAKARLLRGSND